MVFSGALLPPSVAESTHGGPPPFVTREECNNFDNWLLINRLMVRGPSPVDPISRN
uniref:Uncharacterized protein n=1 Tax=Plectus sambesii TaxID=2011161 RepID=A0A914VN92_9BILA